jgi:sodium-dependent phosphate cotransporter
MSLELQKYRDEFEPSGNGKSKKISSASSEDPWAIKEMESTSKPWGELTTKEKVKRVVFSIGKGIAVLALLYFFVCSLDLLSLGFRLVGGRTTGQIFQQSEILQNPVVGGEGFLKRTIM